MALEKKSVKIKADFIFMAHLTRRHISDLSKRVRTVFSCVWCLYLRYVCVPLE